MDICNICRTSVAPYDVDRVQKGKDVYHRQCLKKLPNKVSNEVLNAHVKRVRQDYFRFKEGTRVQ